MLTTKKKRKTENKLALTLMLFPAIFLLVVVSIYPFLWLFRYAFYDYDGFNAYFIGLDNFSRIFRDEIYWESVVQTLQYAALKLIFIIPISLVLAVMLNGQIRAKNLFRVSYFLPTVISSAVYGLIWYFIFNSYNGSLNAIINAIGITDQKIDWLGMPSTAMMSIIVVAIWGGFGNYMILFLAGLQSIPSDIYESSKIDGANKVQDFFYITLPMMGPVLKVILMLAITTALKDYQSIMVLTGGGPVGETRVMYLYVYELMFGKAGDITALQIGYGAVVGIVSSLIIGIVTIAYLRLSKKLDSVY